ncbi:MAG TPA: DUF169 domain-containing protein [Armatimonadota bacterium]|jgi:uncharacterized protein (DUF169 family)
MNRAELIAGTHELQRKIGLRHAPLGFFYADDEPEGFQPPSSNRGCIVAVLSRARRGEVVYFTAETVGCGGGGTFLGFCAPQAGIAEFISTGIPGKTAGERYKASPELARAGFERHPAPAATGRFAVFAPLSLVPEDREPEVIIVFAGADELAGLVFLAGFGREDDAVISPFASGCSALVARPREEARRGLPRAVLGLFDPSARPCVPPDELSFAAPRALWEEMVAGAAASFLSTETWSRVRRRIAGEA